MTDQDVIAPLEPTGELPAIRSIGPADLEDALMKGLDDFWAMPTHVVFLSLIYPVIGLALGRATLGYDIVPLLYPAKPLELVGERRLETKTNARAAGSQYPSRRTLSFT